MTLPASIQEIADVIGQEDALYLIGQLPRWTAGGKGKAHSRVILTVPRKLKPNHRLIQILGPEKAEAMAAAFGGETLHPANCRGLEREWRNREVRRMAGEGRLSAAEIAGIVGLTRRHVQNLTREMPHGDLAAANDDACSHARERGDCGTGR